MTNPDNIEAEPVRVVQVPVPTPPPPPPAEAVADLVAALGELTEPTKGGKADVRSQRGAYSYTYLTLPDLLSAVRPVLAKHGLAVMQEAQRDDARSITVHTRILHKSGHSWVSPPLTMTSDGTPQGIGGALTYARRYQLATMVGLAGAEDDDNAHNQAQAKKRPTPPPEEPPPGVDPETGEILEPAGGLNGITDKQKRAIWAMAGKVWPDLDRDQRKTELAKTVEDIAGSDDVAHLTAAQASQVIATLKAALS